MLRIRNERLAGMTAMLIGTASFAFMDALLKLLVAHYPPTQVAALRGLTALPVVFLWAAFAGGLGQLVRVRWPLHVLRGVLSVIMMITYTFALQDLSLSKTYALFFVAPLIIAVLSIFMLGDRVTKAQWFVIALGFGGVLIVANPGVHGFGTLGTLAVLGTAFAYALSSVLVKIIGRTDSTQSMVFWMTCMLAIGATVLALPDWQPLRSEHYPIMLGIAVTGAIGQWGITTAFKHAVPASVAPLEYSALAWVIALDFALWATLPSWQTLIGAAVIIGSGIFMFRYEARRAQSRDEPLLPPG